jgi:hypothetical protein
MWWGRLERIGGGLLKVAPLFAGGMAGAALVWPLDYVIMDATDLKARVWKLPKVGGYVEGRIGITILSGTNVLLPNLSMNAAGQQLGFNLKNMFAPVWYSRVFLDYPDGVPDGDVVAEDAGRQAFAAAKLALPLLGFAGGATLLPMIPEILKATAEVVKGFGEIVPG